ncbi:hypothetical protein Tco_0465487, partial [Tanacetum coccineum]
VSSYEDWLAWLVSIRIQIKLKEPSSFFHAAVGEVPSAPIISSAPAHLSFLPSDLVQTFFLVSSERYVPGHKCKSNNLFMLMCPDTQEELIESEIDYGEGSNPVSQRAYKYGALRRLHTELLSSGVIRPKSRGFTTIFVIIDKLSAARCVTSYLVRLGEQL